jgi:alpha-mannosidase
MQGLVGGDGYDRRAEYILTKHARGGERFSLHVELAANGMFGVGAAGLINCVDPDRYFTLKQCEIGLFNRDAWSLLWDMEVISDMAAKLPETDSRAAQALYAANAIQNAVWTDDPSTIAKGRQIAADFLKERNSSDCFTLAAIGHW